MTETVRVCVTALVLRPRREDVPVAVLLVKSARGASEGHWVLPGGCLEPGEPLEACAMRELLEETGIQARPPLTLEVVLDPVDGTGDHKYLPLAFQVDDYTGTPGVQDASEIDAVEWHPLYDLPPNVHKVTRLILDSYTDGYLYMARTEGCT